MTIPIRVHLLFLLALGIIAYSISEPYLGLTFPAKTYLAGMFIGWVVRGFASLVFKKG